MDIEFIKDLSRKYANMCVFKSDFPHDWESVNDGYIEGFQAAERLANENLIKHSVSNRWETLNAFFKYLDNLTEREYEVKSITEHSEDYLKSI